jgi:hypothetical protein
MIGTTLNDRSYGGADAHIHLHGGTVKMIDAYRLSDGTISIGVQVDDVRICFYGLDTAENFAAALAEGIANARALVEETAL